MHASNRPKEQRLFSRSNSPNVLALKGGQLGILIIKVPFRIGELLREKSRCSFGRLLACIQAFAYKKGRDIRADLLSCPRALGLKGDGESWNPVCAGCNSINRDSLSREFDAIIHR